MLLTLHETTASVLKKSTSDMTRYFAVHCLKSSANIQVCSGYFFLKSGHFFNFQKGQARPHPVDPPSGMYEHVSLCMHMRMYMFFSLFKTSILDFFNIFRTPISLKSLRRWFLVTTHVIFFTSFPAASFKWFT